MGFVTLFKLMAKSFDVLAWPLITLVYPLCASIRAIESNSNGDNRKWLTYWVLYALIMLFELISAKTFEWLPFWHYMKLIAISWLVLPHFDGAVYVYEHFVRTCITVNPQTFSNWFKNTQMDKLLLDRSDDFLHVAEKYIKENGIEELEKLIVGKAECRETSHARTENNAVTEIIEEVALKDAKCRELSHVRTENNAVTEITEEVALEDAMCRETSHARRENNAVTEITEAVALEEIILWEPNLAQTENITVRTMKSEVMAEVDIGCELPGSSYPKKVQKEWTCALCQVSTSAEVVLKEHLRGKKHRAKEMELRESSTKATKIKDASVFKKSDHPAVAPKKGLSTSVPYPKQVKKKEEKKVGGTGTGDQRPQKKVGVTGTGDQRPQKKVGVTGTGDQRPQNQKKTEVENNQSALWCDTCKLLCNSTAMMNDHRSGKKHLKRCGM